MARIKSRYLEPISIVQTNGTYRGEGFLILTIQCSIIEFLAALKLGYNHRLGAKFGTNFEYGSSKQLFTDFLQTEKPFTNYFTTEPEAITFYEDIRCGLVHEALTKNQWKVWAGSASSIPISFRAKYVNRDLLQGMIDDYILAYGVKLRTDINLQQAFIRKFDYIFFHT